MLGDRTNLHRASPSVLRPIRHATGTENEGRDAKVTISGFVEAEPRKVAPVPQPEDIELNAIRAEHAKIQLSSRFDDVFGDVNERATYDTYILKRQPPEQKIFGYPAEYLKQETGRLTEGFKKLRVQRDNLLRELLDVHAKQETMFEKVTTFVTRMRHEKLEIQRKVIELEKRLRNEMIQSEKTKAALEKEAEQVGRAEHECQEAKAAFAEYERLRIESEASEKDARNRRENAVRLASSLAQEITKAKDEAQRYQRDNEQALKVQANELQSAIEKWQRKEELLEKEIHTTNGKIEELRIRLGLAQSDLQLLRAENQKRETQIESMRERATAAEEKLNVKDGNVNLALQALRESQDLNQVRIETLNKEKIRLESKVEEMLQEKKACQEKVYEASANLDRVRDREEQLTNRVLELEQSLLATNNQLTISTDSLEIARADVTAKITKYAEARDQAERALEQANAERQKFAELSKQASEVKTRISNMEGELSATKKAMEKLNSSPKKMEKILEETKEEEALRRKVDGAAHYKLKMEQLTAELDQVKKQLHEADSQRRALLNEVQGIKGNIRVIARMRPPSIDCAERSENNLGGIVCSVDGMGVSLELPTIQQKKITGSADTHSFSFNRVFNGEASQHVIFEEVVDLVQSALDGYNVCLFSYGQSNSGKSWTIMGDLTNQFSRGLIPRSLEYILCAVAQMREKGWSYDVECTYVEITNEVIRDLLAVDQKQERTSRHDILNRGGNIVVTGLTRMPLQDAEEILVLLEQADKYRDNASTDTKTGSTAAHSVFTIHLVGRNSSEKGGTELVGSLNICDLAGSDGLKDTQIPNTGLSALVAVFTNLSQRSATIPFRNSVLTHILSPCLSGDGKMVMIVNISSDGKDVQESLNSLRFAQLVNKTELGKGKKNIRETQPGGALNRGRNNSQ